MFTAREISKLRKAAGPGGHIEGPIHVDQYLTDFSLMYVQDDAEFIATRAASPIAVQKQTDLYAEYDRGYFWRDEVEARPMLGRPQQAGYKVNQGTYSATEYGLETGVDDRQRANVDDPIDLDEAATIFLNQKHLIKKDRIWTQKFFNSGAGWATWNGVGSSPGANQFLQFSDTLSTPIEVIDAAKDDIKKKTGFMPNTLVLGAKVKRTLRSHPDIADRIKYTQMGVADDAILATLFEVDNVVVARSVYNAAMEGASDDFQFIADETAMLLAYIDPNPTLNSPTAIASFNWTGLIPGASNAAGVIERFRDDRAHSDFFQGRTAWDLKLVAADLGLFFNDVVSG